MADKFPGKLKSYFVVNYIERWQELRTYRAKPFLKAKTTRVPVVVSYRNAWALAALFGSSLSRKEESKSAPDVPFSGPPPKTRLPVVSGNQFLP
ncbi:MAG: hypothetical protein WCQ50_01605 [Spirochaetota bacterium]